MNKVCIRIKDKSNNCISNEVPLEDIIFNQEHIEFVFPNYIDEYSNGEPYEATLPYCDFLFYKNDYEISVEIDLLKILKGSDK